MGLPVKLWQGSDNDFTHPAKTVLHNRGIDDYKRYMNLTDSELYSPYRLKNIETAAMALVAHINCNTTISILVDCDVDGFTSAAIIYNYIKDMSFTGTIHTLFHTKKQHGLDDPEIKVPSDTKLLIIPDAGSNDVVQCKALHESDIDIIILDHHIMEQENPYAIVVNSQDGSYPNKELSGAGVAWKFCQVVDDIQWTDYANKYVDLATVGNIADNMDMHSLETKRIAIKGLAQIVNPALKDYVDFNSYSIGSDEPTCIDVSFYVAPLMNALIRVGTQEQKQRLFAAMTGSKQTYEYTPTRGKNKGITSIESEGMHSAREANACKMKQNKDKEHSIDELRDVISYYKWDNNKVLFVNATGTIRKELTGLVAMNLATIYNRPAVVLIADSDDPTMFGGSIRNVEGGGVDNIKKLLESTGCFDYIKGHENAAGVHIAKAKVPEAIAITNQMLKDVDVKKFYKVDFILDYSQLTLPIIRDMHAMRRIWCQGVPEPLFFVKNVVVPRQQCAIMGKTGTTWKFTDPDTYIEYVCFKGGKMADWINADLYNTGFKTINIVCKLGMNQYGSRVTPQVIIEAYEEV